MVFDFFIHHFEVEGEGVIYIVVMVKLFVVLAFVDSDVVIVLPRGPIFVTTSLYCSTSSTT